jgi:WD40 repeat protein
MARRLRPLAAEAGCLHAAVGPRDLIATAGADGVVRVLSTRTGRVIARCALPRRERPLRVAWSPWPRHVASSHEQALVTVWDLETEVPVRVLRAGNRRVEALAFSGDGRWLAVAGECRLRVFDSSGAQVRDVPMPPDSLPGGARPLQVIHAVAFVPGDRSVLLAGDDGLVRSIDVLGQVDRIWRHPSPVPALAVATDRFATGSAAGRVSTWSYDGRMIHRADHDGRVDQVAFSADGQLLATAGANRSIRIWDREGTAVACAPLIASPTAVGFLSDRTLMSATRAGDIELWAAPGLDGA